MSDFQTGSKSWSTTWPAGGKGNYVRCLASHKPMPLGDTGFVIYGGSCSTPIVNDADVYVGLCGTMNFTYRNWPWKEGHEVLYEIVDGHPPKNPESFKMLVAWVIEQLKDDKKVHVGCIGGHGRTGLLLAAIVAEMCGIEDAITYVRKNYCKKAVERKGQVDFLHEHFGITKVTGSHDSGPGSKKKKKGSTSSLGFSDHSDPVQIRDQTFVMLEGATNIWEKRGGK